MNVESYIILFVAVLLIATSWIDKKVNYVKPHFSPQFKFKNQQALYVLPIVLLPLWQMEYEKTTMAALGLFIGAYVYRAFVKPIYLRVAFTKEGYVSSKIRLVKPENIKAFEINAHQFTIHSLNRNNLDKYPFRHLRKGDPEEFIAAARSFADQHGIEFIDKSI